jgi:hypothetical protein
MSDPEVVELKLDTITRTVRVAASIAPRVMTRVGLGVVLATEDVVNDPAAELLSIKVTDGFMSIVSTISVVARASGSSIGSAASSVKGAIDSTVAKASSLEARATRARRIESLPGLAQARAFMKQAATEVGQTWEAAGTVTVEIAGDEAVVNDQVDLEGSAIMPDPSETL